MKKIILLFAMMLAVGTVSAAKLYATFGTPGGNASYDATTFTYAWTGSTNNLMNCFTFSNGELANYTTLNFTFTELSDGASVRINVLFSDNTNKSKSYYSAGSKATAITELLDDTHTAADITAIRFGGNSNTGSTVVKASEMYLEDNTNELTATFKTPGSNASYSSPTYTWTGSSSNLMTVFEFANGELTKYSKLTFIFSNLVDGPVRVGYYVGSTFTEIGNGYYSAGTKEVDLTTLGVELSTVTSIAFGGRSNAGSCDILATDVKLTGNTTIADPYFHTPASNGTYNAPTYTWTGNGNNLMTIYEFANGELANFETLIATTSNMTSGKSWRMGYIPTSGTYTNFTGAPYYSDGTKTVDLASHDVDMSTVEKIQFGGNGDAGSETFSINVLQTGILLKTRQFSTHDGNRKYTVCLPYALTADEVTAVGGEFYELTSVADGTLHFTKVTETTANKPYVYIPTKEYPFASVALTKTPVAVSETYPISYTVNGYTFTGVTKKGTVPVGAYGYNASDGTFSKVVLASGASESAVTINARRAYIIGPATSGSGAPANLNVVFGEDEATDIENISVQDDANAPIYNVLGQRVDENYKGIIIKNGKKYLVR